MSSKNDNDSLWPAPRSWSLAVRLTTYYAMSAFAIVTMAMLYLHWTIARNMDQSDDRLLTDRVDFVQSMLEKHAFHRSIITKFIDQSFHSPHASQDVHVLVRILDAQHEIVAESPGMSELLPPGRFPSMGDQPGSGTSYEGIPGRSMRFLATDVAMTNGEPGRWVIQAVLDRSQGEKLLSHHRENVCYALAAAFAACIAMGHRIARRGIHPIHDITETAGRIQVASLGQRIATPGLPSELHKLAGTFNDMLSRLQVSFERLSQFSTDIAHELRTPVNNMRGELDVALAKQRSPGEYEEIISSSLEECGRLSHIIDSLLFLARAENPPTQVERSAFDAGVELRKIREFFEGNAHEAGVSITVNAAGDLKVELSRPLFQQAVGNLLSNAIAHTAPGGTVTLRARAAGGGLVVEVTDSGCGIAAEHLPHVFDRFYRVDPSRASTSGGIGLGLAIVKSIVELHGGTVGIESKRGEGTRVEMRFPGRDNACRPRAGT